MLGVSSLVVITGNPLVAAGDVFGNLDRVPVEVQDLVDHGDPTGDSRAPLVLDGSSYTIPADDSALDAFGAVGYAVNPPPDVEALLVPIDPDPASPGKMPDDGEQLGRLGLGQVHPAVADLFAIEVDLDPEPKAVLADHGGFLDAAEGPEPILKLTPEEAFLGRLEVHHLSWCTNSQMAKKDEIIAEFVEAAAAPKCMRWGCQELCWIHPERGRLVLCRDHAEEVFRGEAKAPPLRRNIDYVSVPRRTLLIEDLPKDIDPHR